MFSTIIADANFVGVADYQNFKTKQDLGEFIYPSEYPKKAKCVRAKATCINKRGKNILFHDLAVVDGKNVLIENVVDKAVFISLESERNLRLAAERDKMILCKNNLTQENLLDCVSFLFNRE